MSDARGGPDPSVMPSKTPTPETDPLTGGPPVGVSVDFFVRGMWEIPFWNIASQAGFCHLHRRRFPCQSDRPPDLSALGAELRFSDCGLPGRKVWTYLADGAVLMLVGSGNSVEAMVLSSSLDASAT